MNKRFKNFMKQKPGKRFQYLNRISSAYFKNKNGFFVFIILLISVIFVLLGIVMLLLPGPGLLFILIGVAPLMYLSKNLAKKIDNLESFFHALIRKKNSKS